MISRCRSFRSIFAERAPKKMVSRSFDHERNRYELATVQRYGHENGASRFLMKMPGGIFMTYACDTFGSYEAHMKNSVKAGTSSVCPRPHSHMHQELFRGHRAFVDLTGCAFVAKRGCASPASSPSGLIIDLHRVGSRITQGENP